MRHRHLPGGPARFAVLSTLVLSGALAAFPPAARVARSAPVWEVHVSSGDVRDLAVEGGAIWCATGGGALRFDPASRTFEKWIREPGRLASNFVTAVAVDPAGTRWFGTEDAGVSGLLADGRSWVAIGTRDGLPSSKVNLVTTAGSRLHVATPSGYAVFEGGLAGEICFDDPSSACPLRGAGLNIKDIVYRGDTLWVATATGLHRRIGAAWEDRSDGLGSDRQVRSVAFHEGVLWAAAASNPYRADTSGVLRPFREGLPATASIIGLREIGGTLYALATVGVYRLREGAFERVGILQFEARDLVEVDGLLWAATPRGLWVFENDAWTHVAPPGPPIGEFFHAIDVDASGSVWVGTRQGIVRFADGAWTLYTPRENGLQDNWILSLLADRAGRIWFGHCCCFGPPACRLDLLPSAGAVTFTSLALYDNRIITEDAEGRIWVGSESLGMSVFDPRDSSVVRFTNQLTGGNLNSDNVRGIVFAPPGMVTIAHATNGLNRLDTKGTVADLADDEWSAIRQGAGSGFLRNGNVVSLAAGPNGEVYAATGAGLEIVNPSGSTSILRQTNGLNDQAMTAVAVAPDGTVWVGSRRGVNVVVNGQVAESFTAENSPIADEGVSAIAIDPTDGSAWIASDHGVSRVRLEGAAGGGAAARFLYPNPWRPDGAGALPGAPGSASSVRVGNAAEDATARVFALNGEEIAAFARRDGTLSWDGRGKEGRLVAAGLYLVVVRDRGAEETLRLAIVR